MRGLNMVGFVESFQCDLPVAIEDAPFAPAETHVLQLERVQHAGDGIQVVEQGLAVGIQVDPDPASPGVHLYGAESGALFVERTLPVFLVRYVGVLAVQVKTPAVIVAEELAALALGISGAGRDVNQSPAAMRADIVIGANLIGRADDDD